MNKLLNPIFGPVKKRRQAKLDKQKELDITFGEQDALDVLSYAGLEENADHLCIDGVYMRTLYVSGYPFVANSGWMDSLINFNHDTDISYHLHEVNALSALPKLHRKITELESTKRAMMRAGKIVGSRLPIHLIRPLNCAIKSNVVRKIVSNGDLHLRASREFRRVKQNHQTTRSNYVGAVVLQ